MAVNALALCYPRITQGTRKVVGRFVEPLPWTACDPRLHFQLSRTGLDAGRKLEDGSPVEFDEIGCHYPRALRITAAK